MKKFMTELIKNKKQVEELLFVNVRKRNLLDDLGYNTICNCSVAAKCCVQKIVKGAMKTNLLD